MKSWYLREDFLDMIQSWLWGRELWFGKGTPRPLKADSLEEFKGLVEKYGREEGFPLFISTQIFSDPLKLENENPDKLRINWDFFLDLDSEKGLEDAKRAAVKAQKTLEHFHVEDYILKFSGRRGFHLIIPGLSLDIFAAGEYRLAYPKLAVNLARFFEAVINEPHVKVDTQVYQPRQMMRAPYSIHENTGLVSVPIDDPTEFSVEDAKVENVKVYPTPLVGRVGEAKELLFSLRDWLKERQTESGLKILSWGEARPGESRGYGWIERLLANPVDDGRHRLLWLVVAPYLVNVKGVRLSEAEKTAYEWLAQCGRAKPIEGNLNRLAKYYVEYAARTGLKPLSLQTIKTKPEYRELWEIVSKAMPKPGVSMKLLKIVSLTKTEPEYEVEKSLLAEVEAVYKEVKGTFNKYPESKHWKEKEKRNMILGWLGEKVFDMVLNQFKIPHVWHHPLIQNEMVGKGERLGPDFTVYRETVDVKVSSHETKPEFYYVNLERLQKTKPDILVFLHFSPDFKRAWLSGWLHGKELGNFPVEKLRFTLGYKVDSSKLHHFNELLKKWCGK